jgi:hypothetical protein
MSSTNHTTNYNLPQFIGTDKPAWLGDINPAMAAIDSQMKTNADNITATNGDLAVTDAKADDAIGRVATLESALNLTNFTTLQGDEIAPWSSLTALTVQGAGITVAQNATGSIFKCYGEVILNNSTASDVQAPHVNVPGLTGIRGYKTIKLTTTPTDPYIIKCAGYWELHTSNGIGEAFPLDIAVGSDGYVYIDATTSTATPTITAGTVQRYSFWPCLYFNANFGDQPD